MKTLLDVGILAVTVLMMVTVGVNLTTKDFRSITKQKRMFACSLLLPIFVLPLLAFGLAKILELPPYLTAGILLLAACPVGDIANFYTLLLSGNLALSVSVNTFSCLLSGITMAVVFAGYDHLLGYDYSLAPPTATLALRLTLMIALPLLGGMALRRWKEGWVANNRERLHALCLAGVVFLVIYVLVNRWAQVVAEWRMTAMAGAAFLVAAMSVGLGLGRLLRLNANDSMTVGIVFAVRNVVVASAIAISILGRLEFAEIAVVYFLVEVPLLLGAVAAYRRWRTRISAPGQISGLPT